MTKIVSKVQKVLKKSKATPERFGEFLLSSCPNLFSELYMLEDEFEDEFEVNSDELKSEYFDGESIFDCIKNDNFNFNTDDNPMVQPYETLFNNIQEKLGEPKLVGFSPDRTNQSNGRVMYYDAVFEFSKQDGYINLCFMYDPVCSYEIEIQNEIQEVEREVFRNKDGSKEIYNWNKIGKRVHLR